MKVYKLVIGFVHPKEWFNTITYHEVRYFLKKDVADKVLLKFQTFLAERGNDFETRKYLSQYLENLNNSTKDSNISKYSKVHLQSIELFDKVSVYLDFLEDWPENKKELLLFYFTCNSRFVQLEEIEVEE